MAMSDVTSLIESKMGKGLKKFLKHNIVDLKLSEQLAISDKALGALIKKKFNIDILFTENTHEIIRGIRQQFTELVSGLSEKDSHTMSLSLSHTLNRFKLKFSPEKVDTMIIQAVGLLDDIDKQSNNFSMRLKEWYGWHFPELNKIVTDNFLYAKIIKAIGMRTEAKHCQTRSELIPDTIKDEILQAAEISMGTDIPEEDLINIKEVADRVIELSTYRETLALYLKYRMEAIAPNLTYLVGELVGARLISHAGSLMTLAKHPASTIQILGAEKALFRALKTKQSTPKYGLIYHAHTVGQTVSKLKGKASRSLAAKLALCCRVDAFGNATELNIGKECKFYLEKRIDEIQNEATRSAIGTLKKPEIQKYEPKYRPQNSAFDTNTDAIRTKRVQSENNYAGNKKQKTA